METDLKRHAEMRRTTASLAAVAIGALIVTLGLALLLLNPLELLPLAAHSIARWLDRLLSLGALLFAVVGAGVLALGAWIWRRRRTR